MEGYPAAEKGSGRRELLVSRTWFQVAALVILIGFFVLGLLAYRTYQSDPPIPARAVDPSGATVYTAEDVREGQKVFLHKGLMEYGSIFGHGAYLGPDFTADYLRRSSDSVREQLGGDKSDSAHQQTIEQFQGNRYDSGTGTLRLSAEQANAFEELNRHYEGFFREPTTRFGLRPEPIDSSEQIRELTAFFAWSSWTASARRPGHNYSYTNNWPPEREPEHHLPNTPVHSLYTLALTEQRTRLLLGQEKSRPEPQRFAG